MKHELSRERLEERIRAEIELLEISLKNGGSDSPHNDEELLEVFRLALEAHEQEPVAYMCDGDDGREYNGHNEFSCGGRGIPLYTHPAAAPAVPVAYRWNYGGSTNWRLTEKTPDPGDNDKCPRVIQALAVIPGCIVSDNEPVPAVPDEMTIRDACKFVQDMRISDDVAVIVMRTWNACRAAMLNGGKS